MVFYLYHCLVLNTVVSTTYHIYQQVSNDEEKLGCTHVVAIHFDFLIKAATHMIKIYFLCAYWIDSVKHCNLSKLRLPNNISLRWFCEVVSGSPWGGETSSARTSWGEAACTEALGARGGDIVMVLASMLMLTTTSLTRSSTAASPDCGVMLLSHWGIEQGKRQCQIRVWFWVQCEEKIPSSFKLTP